MNPSAIPTIGIQGLEDAIVQIQSGDVVKLQGGISTLFYVATVVKDTPENRIDLATTDLKGNLQIVRNVPKEWLVSAGTAEDNEPETTWENQTLPRLCTGDIVKLRGGVSTQRFRATVSKDGRSAELASTRKPDDRILHVQNVPREILALVDRPDREDGSQDKQAGETKQERIQRVLHDIHQDLHAEARNAAENAFRTGAVDRLEFARFNKEVSNALNDADRTSDTQLPSVKENEPFSGFRSRLLRIAENRIRKEGKALPRHTPVIGSDSAIHDAAHAVASVVSYAFFRRKMELYQELFDSEASQAS